jgi:hypothetical protein
MENGRIVREGAASPKPEGGETLPRAQRPRQAASGGPRAPGAAAKPARPVPAAMLPALAVEPPAGPVAVPVAPVAAAAAPAPSPAASAAAAAAALALAAPRARPTPTPSEPVAPVRPAAPAMAAQGLGSQIIELRPDRRSAREGEAATGKDTTLMPSRGA